MSTQQERSAASLRREFDASFAEAENGARSDTEDFLLIGVGGDGFALRLSDIGGLLVDRRIVPLPSPTPGLLGIIGLRGTIVPVHDLGAALGYACDRTPRWLVLARAADPIAFGFDRFEAHRRVRAGSISASDGGEHARPHIAGVLAGKDGARPVIHLASLLQSIARDRATSTPPKER